MKAEKKQPYEPDTRRAIDLVMQLMAIPGESGNEAEVAGFIERRLREAGAPASALQRDAAHRRTPVAGNTGNLVFRLPGTRRAPRRMLSAHMDTVPTCLGSRPVRRGKQIRSADPATGLGADDRAGVAVVLNTALEILTRGLPHPPLTFCWFVQEEVGLHGSRQVKKSLLGKPRLAFNWDGGSPYKLTIGATGSYRLMIEVEGLAAHAGLAPESGVSAIAIASLAIVELERDGWHGQIRKGRKVGTSNVGTIRGGQTTNVIPDRVVIRAEARSHDPAFRRRIVREIERAFSRAARQVKNASGVAGRVRVEKRLDYESFRLPENDPCVQIAERAVRSLGQEPERAIANGGIDPNWTNRHGIPTVSLGCGQVAPHTVREALEVERFREACRIALRLATASESRVQSGRSVSKERTA
jgi:tripeptide aminopeptidase